MAKIAGGSVNDGPGVITISSDQIFHLGSATFSARAAGLLKRAADLLTARADPAGEVDVTAFTDSQGSTALTRRQAAVVTRHLRQRVRQLTIAARAGGAAHPVARNSTSMGQDSPAGQALNRRIEVSYRLKSAAEGESSYVRPALPPAIPVYPTGPSATPSATSTPVPTAQTSDLFTVGPAHLEPGSDARFTAGIRSVRVDGGMTLVSLVMRANRQARPVGAFSARGGTRTDLGGFHLVDPTSGQVFVPAYDAQHPDRVAGTFTHRLEAQTPYGYSFFTTALPQGRTTVDVALAIVGTAESVPFVRIGS